MEGCLFCGIVAGTIPSTEVAASRHSYAFRDVLPVAPSHVLVVPREHIEDAAAITPADGEIISDMLELARGVASSEGLSERGYRLVFNVGPESGNSVPHLHLHVLGGRFMSWPPG